MDEDNPTDEEAADDRVWLAGLLSRLGPEAAYEIAALLGIDLDAED